MSNVAKLKKRALDYEQKKQFDKALDTYIQVLGALGDHVDEGDVALFNRVGDLLLGQGNVSSAVDHYERAVDLYSDGGFHNNAIALCKKILRNAPGRNSVYYKLGRISARKGFASDAKTNFLEYADRMQRIGHVDEAFRALKEFADLCPDQDDIRLMLAEQLVRAERKEEAVEQLQLHYERLAAEGRTQEAKATLDRMIALDPSHRPKTGVSRPTPKANDLIFLDVGFDTPGTPSRTVTGSVPVVPSAAASPVAQSPDAEEQGDAAAQPLPLIELGENDQVEIAPIEGLSSGAIFESDAAASPASGSHELAGEMNSELITGFEKTSLGVMDEGTDAVAPLDGLEQSSPLAEGFEGLADLSFDVEAPAGTSEPPEEPAGMEAVDIGAIEEGSDDALPLLDMSLDLVDDDASENGDGLTLIFPDSAVGDDWSGSAPAGFAGEQPETPRADGVQPIEGEETFSTDLPDVPELLALPEDEVRLEPLLQLPDLDPLEGSSDMLGEEPDLPLISQEDEPLAMAATEDGSEATIEDEDFVSVSSSELRFLDLGSEAAGDDATPVDAGATSVEPLGDDMTGVPASDGAVVDRSSSEQASAPAAEPTLDDLRAIVDLNPEDWEARRQLAEALLEGGDRHGGIAELEGAMLGLEQAGDLRGATAFVNEIIRVEPHLVRYHQKRVEYAVRANDRAQLAEAYYSLAESLFQMGEIDKSRAVYTRVLELLPGDGRVRAALQAIDALAEADAADEPEQPAAPVVAERPPSSSAPVAIAAVSSVSADDAAPPAEAEAASAAAEESMVPRQPEAEPAPAAVAGDFVNLADWLSEDAPERNTRMVADVKEPEIQEQVDFAEMLAMFKQGVAANVDEADHEAHYDLGVAYKEMGLLDEAISEFQKALRGTGNRARTYEALGQCFVERGQHQIAVTILSRALGDKSYTDDMLVGVLYLLGYASETLGRWPDAQRFYERVFAVDIEFRDIAERLAVAERAGK
ncbi:MAG TPA: tetratricopeptide repeat protein [Gemmatimonadaceae bacterium]|nr:tetratricopeptide repeat protein [Gemmatimonadaceae bacterium]